MQTAPPGASESQARDGEDLAWGRRVALWITRSTRPAGGRGGMWFILNNNMGNWTRSGTMALGENGEKLDKKETHYKCTIRQFLYPQC